MLFKNKKEGHPKTKKAEHTLILRNFLLSLVLCLGLFFLPAIISNVYAAYCLDVKEINVTGFLSSWVVGFKMPYSDWLGTAEEIKKKHKLQPGVFAEAVGLNSIITSSSSSSVLADIKTKADNIFTSGMSSDNPDLTLSDRAGKRITALRDAAGMAAYKTALNSYNLTLDIDQQLKDFSPSKLDVAATSQIQKDITKLQQLTAQVKAEAIKVEAMETSVKAILH